MKFLRIFFVRVAGFSLFGVVASSLAAELSPPVLPPAAPDATPFGVPDLIERATIEQTVLSPDGSRIAVVIQRGNLARNTRDYELLLFHPGEKAAGLQPEIAVQFSSSSHHAAIEGVQWLGDNATLAFFGERPGEMRQVYTFDSRARRLTQRTRATTPIVQFAASDDGSVLIYAVEPEPAEFDREAMSLRGFVVPRDMPVSAVMTGKWTQRMHAAARPPYQIHVADEHGDRLLSLPFSHGTAFELHSISPDGRLALLTCMPRELPASWEGYHDTMFRFLARLPARRGLRQLMLLDLTNPSAMRPLANLPFMEPYVSCVWAPDCRSIVLANALLPLDGVTEAERSLRATNRMLAEIDIATGQVRPIATRDNLIALRWSRQPNVVEFAIGRATGQEEPGSHVFYRRTSAGWELAEPRDILSPSLLIEQGLNQPPRLMVVDPGRGLRQVAYDSALGLLASKRFGPVSELRWNTRGGEARTGGLYWPVNFEAGKRYPLVIQTHRFHANEFAPDGAYATDNAAQPLANAGVIVLQLPNTPREHDHTSDEGEWNRASIESAIDYLDHAQLIDRTKVGLQGFSRTCYHVLYFLTHSDYPIAAASLADGVDGTYVQQVVALAQQNLLTGGHTGEEDNGGSPYGPTLQNWLERSPSFSLDRVRAPVRLTALGFPMSVLGEWEAYMGLLMQGKPAELIYIPDGGHDIEKPWARFTSQQGVVDWYRFWLQGVERSEPIGEAGETTEQLAHQYERWRKLREEQDHALRVPRPPLRDWTSVPLSPVP